MKFILMTLIAVATMAMPCESKAQEEGPGVAPPAPIETRADKFFRLRAYQNQLIEINRLTQLSIDEWLGDIAVEEANTAQLRSIPNPAYEIQTMIIESDARIKQIWQKILYHIKLIEERDLIINDLENQIVQLLKE